MPDEFSDKRGNDAIAQAPANGVACAFAILVDHLETSGALPMGAYERSLRSVLEQAGIDQSSRDGRFLTDILDLLGASPRSSLSLIDGGLGKSRPLENC